MKVTFYAVFDTNVLVSAMMSRRVDSPTFALSKDGAFMVTGNLRHFPKTPIVVTPAEMMKIVGVND